MIVSIASGKGGTGKTTIAVNMALSLKDVQLLDCDVEEPNCHIFLKASIDNKEDVKVKIPKIDETLCDNCGKCADFCEYNALASAGGKIIVFSQLCHSCGGCVIVCPKKAITEEERVIGAINHASKKIDFSYGVLNIGEIAASPLIRELKKHTSKVKDVLIDAPPGTSCATISAVESSDYCILVTEPTPFGLNDLKIAVEMLETMNIPCGVIVNRAGIGDNKVFEYCKSKNIPILLLIPHDKRIAELYSDGIPFVEKMGGYKKQFVDVFNGIRREKIE